MQDLPRPAPVTSTDFPLKFSKETMLIQRKFAEKRDVETREATVSFDNVDNFHGFYSVAIAHS